MENKWSWCGPPWTDPLRNVCTQLTLETRQMPSWWNDMHGRGSMINFNWHFRLGRKDAWSQKQKLTANEDILASGLQQNPEWKKERLSGWVSNCLLASLQPSISPHPPITLVHFEAFSQLVSVGIDQFYAAEQIAVLIANDHLFVALLILKKSCLHDIILQIVCLGANPTSNIFSKQCCCYLSATAKFKTQKANMEVGALVDVVCSNQPRRQWKEILNHTMLF